MAQPNPILEARDLVKTYPSDDGSEPLIVLDGVSLTVDPGSVISVIGSSGSGKSTLLHILGGLDKPDSGEVYWGNRLINEMNEDERAAHRNRETGFVFQFHHLLPEFTALENVFIPALIQGVDVKQAEKRANLLLDRFGIKNRGHHRPTQLSGGEQQRVAMARALMNNPKLILADEPTGNLDEKNTNTLLDMLFELREKDGVSIVLVTHEKNIAERSDLIYELRKGKIHQLP